VHRELLWCAFRVEKVGLPRHRKRLGSAIRKRRLALGLSQEQLAERVDCHRNYVGNVERGEQNISIDMLMRFTMALECTLASLIRNVSL
jgi:transcriptional regulator with XRE-family HTH domain